MKIILVLFELCHETRDAVLQWLRQFVIFGGSWSEADEASALQAFEILASDYRKEINR